MKVLLVSDGPHDIGRGEGVSGEPVAAGGTVTTLVRRVCPEVGSESLGIPWRKVPVLKRGFSHKVVAAALLGRKHGCAATVCVSDQDRDPERRQALAEGAERAERQFPSHPVAWGVAVESIEAWTLGARKALAEELGLDEARLEREYRLRDVEKLHENDGRPDQRPKAVLERVAQLAHREPDTTLREAVAERTDPDELARTCPEGFGDFAERLREKLGAEEQRARGG